MRILGCALLFVLACGGGGNGAAPDGAAPDAAAASSHLVTVQQGFGAGTYAAGTTVHVWADLDPGHALATGWSGGDAALLAAPAEWHTTFVMPDHDVALAAQTKPVTTVLQHTTFTGVGGTVRQVYSFIPADPRGLVLFMHGTGGSAKFITTVEALYVANAAVDAGYGVLATDAEEAAAGDQNGDGNIRWDIVPSATNKDLIDLDAMIAGLQSSHAIATTTPVYALGMSDGGAMSIVLGALGATSFAATFPHLALHAVISHCADGPAQAATITTTPTAWHQCGADDNPQVSNSAAMQNSQTIAARGIATEYLENPPSPLYDQRFERDGLDAPTSSGIAAELRQFTDSSGLFTTGSVAIQTMVQSSPSAFPALSALPPAKQDLVLDQLRAMEAEHQMYSDLASRDVAWFLAHP